MRKKILAFYIILIFIGITITGFFSSQLTQKFYKHEVEERLKSSAKLIKHQILMDLSENQQINYNDFAKTYAEILNYSSGIDIPTSQINARVTFVNFNGRVLGESETDYKTMGNHGNRKEIREAKKSKIGKDIRFSKTLKMNYLYVAIPITNHRLIVRVSVPLIQLKKIDKIIRYYTIAGIIAGMILTTLLALKFSSAITRPVNHLISVSNDIARGNYSQRVKIHSKDELGQLSETFNKMAVALEKTVIDLTDKNIKVNTIMNSMKEGIIAVDRGNKVILVNSIACEMFGIENRHKIMGNNIMQATRNNKINNFLKKTIEENTSMTDEINIGAEKKILRIYTNPIKSKNKSSMNSGGIVIIQDITNIKRLEKMRTKFVSNVTHELKTPLTSIRGFVETLRSGALNDKKVAGKFLQIIDIEADRLYNLINDILNLSEIETKKEDNDIQICNLKSIINEILPILQKTCEKNNVEIIEKIEEGIEVPVNKNRIKQMLINLIDNAVKYNKKKGSVTLKAFKSEGKVVIQIIDTGIGIPAEHLPRVFERFYRVDKGRSRKMGGTGLGLSIVKHIVNLYNGDIKIKSTVGEGTEITIQLPV